MNSHYLLRRFQVYSVLVILSLFVISCGEDEDEPVKQDNFTINFSNYMSISDQCDIAHDVSNSVTLTVSHAEAEDCSGELERCGFDIEERGLWLYPSRATLDISKLETPSKITFVYTDWCSIGCTRFFLYDASGNLIESKVNTAVSDEETVSFETNLDKAKTIAFSTCEGCFKNVTFTF